MKRILSILLIWSGLAASSPAGEWFSAPEYNFRLPKPAGWQEIRDNLGKDLVCQLMSADRSAFVEVYAARGSYPGPVKLAEVWETIMRARGLPQVQKCLRDDAVLVGG